jgi:hypothetical protein
MRAPRWRSEGRAFALPAVGRVSVTETSESVPARNLTGLGAVAAIHIRASDGSGHCGRFPALVNVVENTIAMGVSSDNRNSRVNSWDP